MSNVQIRLLEFGGRVKGRSPLKRKLRKLALKKGYPQNAQREAVRVMYNA